MSLISFLIIYLRHLGRERDRERQKSRKRERKEETVLFRPPSNLDILLPEKRFHIVLSFHLYSVYIWSLSMRFTQNMLHRFSKGFVIVFYN